MCRFSSQNQLPSTSPDNYGTGVTPIDFGYTANGGAGGTIDDLLLPRRFGAGCSKLGPVNARAVGKAAWCTSRQSGNLLSSRAITLWGATGHIHGWRLYPKRRRLSMDTSMIRRQERFSRARKIGSQRIFAARSNDFHGRVTVGMVSMLGVFGLAMAATQTSQQRHDRQTTGQRGATRAS